jgi:hypothetical protein
MSKDTPDKKNRNLPKIDLSFKKGIKYKLNFNTELSETTLKAIDYLYHPESFVESIQTKPWQIAYDFTTQLTIRILQIYSIIPITKTRNKAKRILKQAGLSAFIPREAKNNRRCDCYILYFRYRPDILKSTLNNYKDYLKNYIKKRYRSPKDKIKDIEKAFVERYKNPMPKGLFKANNDPDIKMLTMIGLKFLAYEQKLLPIFQRLKEVYTKPRRNQYIPPMTIPEIDTKKMLLCLNALSQDSDLLFPSGASLPDWDDFVE